MGTKSLVLVIPAQDYPIAIRLEKFICGVAV